MSEGKRGTEGRAPEPAGCLPSGVGRPWVLVVAMLVPVVLGGALLVVSLTGVGVPEQQAGEVRADGGEVGVESRGPLSFARPEVVYGRAVVKVAKSAERRRQEVAAPRRRSAKPAEEAKPTEEGKPAARARRGPGERERRPTAVRRAERPRVRAVVRQRGRGVERGRGIERRRLERDKKAEECPPEKRRGMAAAEKRARGAEMRADAGERVIEQERPTPLLQLRILSAVTE